MNRKIVKLTESDFHRIVKNSINKVLKESYRDIDDDNYYGGGLPDNSYNHEGDEPLNDYEDFEGKPAWQAIENVIERNGLEDLKSNQYNALLQISKPLQKLNKYMEEATKEFYKDANGKQKFVNQDDIIRFVDESLPDYYALIKTIKKLWLKFGWMVEKR